MHNQSFVPSRVALDVATATNRANGHENLGFLSESHGFMPIEQPLGQLPPAYRAWDAIVDQMPMLWRTLGLREAIDSMPVLSAASQDLPDRYLQRASSIISIFAHSYYRVEPEPPAALPESIQRPWEEITQRLERPRPFMSYVDLIVYNWKLRDTHLPMQVENMQLLIPTVGNQEENVFYLGQVEVLARSAPIIGAVVRAQEAVVGGDVGALQRELIVMLECLERMIERAILKVDPNPYSSTFIDTVVWAKTVASLAVPIAEGVHGPSGSGSPIFQLMDVFLGRAQYDSRIGGEMLQLRAWYPRHWREFLQAVGAVSVRQFVERSGDRRLQGLFQTLVDTYAGEKGILGVHRIKAYGFLRIAFKAGRALTISGFSSKHGDATWDIVNAELNKSRMERHAQIRQTPAFGLARSGTGNDPTASQWITHVALQVDGAGVRYRTGDRCGILPENSPELVERTLRALRANGSELVPLDRPWQEAMRQRSEGEPARDLPLALLLRYGKIRPVMREVAKALLRLTASEKLKSIVNARAEDQWELWDLIDLLAEGGFDPQRLWRAEPWEAESICKIVPPESLRLYSIASAMEDPHAPGARELHLNVGKLVYNTGSSDTSVALERYGTASNFLSRVVAEHEPHPVALQVSPAWRFHLPADPERPIVMFAGGSGISPFRGFMEERGREEHGGENWLFFSTRTPERLFYRDELQRWVAAGRLHLHVAFSDTDVELRWKETATGGSFEVGSGRRRRISDALEAEETAACLWDLLRAEPEGGKGAYFYICGSAGFAQAVMSALKNVVRRFATDGDGLVQEALVDATIRRLVAEGRYKQDIFTTYGGLYQERGRALNASDVVLRNNDREGYWFIVSGKVYDVGEFMHLHAGGHRLIRENAGLDATPAYRAVLHHRNTEVDAMLGMYEIGYIRRLDFKSAWGVAIGPEGLFYISLDEAFRTWVRFLYLIVDMENALTNDYSVLDRPTTDGEDPSELTPYKMQLAADTHQRFMLNHLATTIGEPFMRLWSITVSLCAPADHILRLRDELERIESSPEGRLARSSPGQMQALNDRLIRRRDEEPQVAEQLRELCMLVYEHDLRLLHDVKMALRDGVQVWEEHEARAIAAGGNRLLQSIDAVPRLVMDYYGRIAAELRALGLGGIDVDERGFAPSQGVSTDMVGHGTVAVLDHQKPTDDLEA